ncbi:MAG: GTPase ObgE [Flavobacteriaceae bacterium]|mgnify:CR=1 FL=1|nr:GTPase ObgE [Flavobacteriaceae bacterium]MDG1343936.1 GTPase ObgE [Flavobacteriaceae bacterium]MDG1791669.1 GTPase ObgE [Flavobacteriaceae bacterium]
MTEGNFVDYVKINVFSGNGGKGSAHFRREKYITKGGPDGGDGGRGGHVIFVTDKSLWTLHHFRFQKHFKCGHGGDGSGSRSTGADGSDALIRVPVGTVIRDTETNKIIYETIADGDQKIILDGGKGGLGNWNFRSSTNQAPRYSQPGIKGKERQLTLELKLLADVGLVGFPNVGKSTLLKTITSAKPKIGNYEFTTLKPNLGIVQYRDYRSFVMADIPGIIEGASEGRGLGHHFLRHIERNSVLLFLLSAESEDVVSQYKILLNELKKYNPELLDKQRIIAISKSDLIDDKAKLKAKKNISKNIKNVPFEFISSVSNIGLVEIKDLLWKVLNE